MTEKELNTISSRTGTDAFIKTSYNGKEIRKAYQTKPWKSDYEIYKQESEEEETKDETVVNDQQSLDPQEDPQSGKSK